VILLQAVLLSLGAALAAGLGGIVVVVLGGVGKRTYAGLLGFAAGTMTAIATLGLIHESTQHGRIVPALAGIAAGALLLYLLDHHLPHEHPALSGVDPRLFHRGLMLFSAITLHHIPEGLAVGTGFATDPRLGLLLALAIALHHIPEGIAIAGPFRAGGLPRRSCVLWAMGSALVEPLAALAGALSVRLWQPLMPFSLAFAGGAMLYVVSDELIPESHSHGFEHAATLGFVGGFAVFLVLLRAL
jgi:ZIP family zinc transporter